MDFSFIYIVSQVITFVFYGILGISYLQKNRITVIILNMIVDVLQAIAMALLNGYTGAAMAIITLFRDTSLLIQEKTNNINNKIFDKLVLVITFILIIIFTCLTYNGFFSLLSVGASLVSTYAIWQKNNRTYKLLGILTGMLWFSYNIFIFSIVGMLLEFIIVLFSTIGYIKDIKYNKE